MTEKLEETIESSSLAEEEKKEDITEESDEENEENSKKPFSGIIKEIIVYLLVLVFCVTVVPRYVIQRTQVDGESMENTLNDLDNLLVEKITYHFKNPSRFDIVTLYPEGKKGKNPKYYIKRIIGLPGENVRIAGNKIYIDGKILKENYGKDKYIEDPGDADGDGITLKEDEYFVMGDNRNNSTDSRDFEDVGPVKLENIDGHAVFRICSFKKKSDGSSSIDFSKFGTLN